MAFGVNTNSPHTPRILITGGSGFVAPYLKKELAGQDVVMSDRGGRGVLSCDVTNQSQVDNLIKKIKPDEIYHLAAISSPKNKDRAKVMKINVDGTLNLLRAAQKFSPNAKILLISTGYIYGETKKPATEKTPPDAHGPYAESKLKMEREALKKFPDLDIRITRSFNHSGAGQQLGLFFPDLVEKIAKAKKNHTGSIEVINPNATRDFLHVRDVVAAYKLIMRKGFSGEIYNVCSGKNYKIRDLVEKLLKAAKLKNTQIIAVEKRGVMALVGVNSKLKKLGFSPKYSVDDIIHDLV